MHQRLKVSWAVILAAVVTLGGGCPSSARSMLGPEAVLKQYAAAIEAGRHDAAYELMSLEFRRRHDRQSFVRMLGENPDEVRLGVEQLRGEPQAVKVSAEVDYGVGDSMKLQAEGGGWRIASDPINFYDQRTPAAALRSFVRAIERRRYEIVLRFVPNKWVSSMTADMLRRQWEGDKRGEVQRLLKNLRANVDAPIRQTGNRATMAYGDKYEVRFLREDGVWKIEDPD